MSSACHRLPVRRACLLAGAMCLLVSGCFSGEYGRRLDQTVGMLVVQGEKAAAVFASATDVVDKNRASTGISLRLPVFVDGTAKPLGADSDNAQPPFCDLPGFSFSYEVPFDGVPGYVYFAAVTLDEKPTETVMQEVQAAVGRAFAGAAWQDVTLETFSGGSMAVKRLSVMGPQPFGTEKSEGQFDLYLVPSGSYSVLIGWRASLETATAQKFFEKTAVSMGTVTGML